MCVCVCVCIISFGIYRLKRLDQVNQISVKENGIIFLLKSLCGALLSASFSKPPCMQSTELRLCLDFKRGSLQFFFVVFFCQVALGSAVLVPPLLFCHAAANCVQLIHRGATRWLFL